MVGWNNCTPQRYMIQLFGILPKHVYNSLVIVWIGTSIQVTDYRCKVILCIGIPADIFTNHIPFEMETLKCMYLSFYQYIILLFAVFPPPPTSLLILSFSYYLFVVVVLTGWGSEPSHGIWLLAWQWSSPQSDQTWPETGQPCIPTEEGKRIKTWDIFLTSMTAASESIAHWSLSYINQIIHFNPWKKLSSNYSIYTKWQSLIFIFMN